MLSLRAMRYIQAAMRRGSIAAAADELNVAASAVSAALDQAESTFGMSLAIRTRSKGISPTSAGRIILQRIEDLLERYEALLVEGAEMQAGFTGSLRIGYYAPIAPAFLPHVVTPLVAENPSLRLAFDECDNVRALEGLLDGSFDVILFVEDAPTPSFVAHRLIHAPGYFLCPATHPFAGRDDITLRDLATQPLILLERPVASAYYRDLLERAGQPINVVATANSTEMVRSLVGAGMGCSVLNMWPGTDVSYGGDALVSLPISDNSSGLTLSLGLAQGPRRRVVQYFVDACLAFFTKPDAQRLVVRRGSRSPRAT